MRREPAFFEHTLRSKRFNRAFSRRALLRSLGAGAAVAPFLPLLNSHAAPGDFEPRLLLLFSANGTIHENWVPTGTTDDFELSPILAPLAPYKDQLIVVDGLTKTGSGPGDSHQRGIGMLWSGNELLSGTQFPTGDNNSSCGWGGGITIDQAIANDVGTETAYKSLEFGVRTGGADVLARQSYAGSNQPIAPEDNPALMFERLFGGLDVDDSALLKRKAERKSVIDVVRGDLDRLRGKYSADDQLKVEAHLEAIRAIEVRNELAVPTCEVPQLDLAFDPQATENYPEVSRRQIDLLVMAFACELTRVASLQWSRAASNLRLPWTGVEDAHHELSHRGDSDQSMIDKITTINTWYAGEVAYLLERLASVPEGDGTMLDNTIVVWGNELARGNSHGGDPIPFVIAGGGAGVMQPGRFLRYDNASHHRLLVSLAHAMGVDSIQSFGNTDPSTGPLSGLLA